MRLLVRAALVLLAFTLLLQIAPTGLPEAQAQSGSLAPTGTSSTPTPTPAQAGNAANPVASTSRATPPVRPITVQRGGQTFNTVTYETEIDSSGHEVSTGSLLVKFKRGAGTAIRSTAHQAAGAMTVDALGLPDIERIRVPSGGVSAALAAYRSQADVEYAEPDYISRRTLTPNDPQFGQQWGMAKIKAPQAWDRTRSRSDIRIAILDCGVYTRSSPLGPGHPDVRDKIVAEIDFTSSPYGADDLCDHGTHVAGVAAAATNNGVGVAGVGFDASIMNVKVLDDDGIAPTSIVAQGIVWAADNGARVINLSLGSNVSCTQTYQTAVNYAWSRNVVIVAASGNENLPSSGQPGNCANVISVAATDSVDGRASFSNYGANVDVAAPGVGILSTDYLGGYEILDGTSQATPHVAGLAALLWATEHGSSNQAVVNRILSTADQIPGTGSLWANGRINAAAAVAAAVVTPTLTPTPTPSPTPTPRPPVSCVPRPRVIITTIPFNGRLLVAVSAQGANNTVESVRFGAPGRPPVNVSMDVSGGPSGQTGDFTYVLPQPQVTFHVVLRRVVAGQPMTLPMVVTDRCGDWPTLVGAGTSAAF